MGNGWSTAKVIEEGMPDDGGPAPPPDAKLAAAYGNVVPRQGGLLPLRPRAEVQAAMKLIEARIVCVAPVATQEVIQ